MIAGSASLALPIRVSPTAIPSPEASSKRLAAEGRSDDVGVWHGLVAPHLDGVRRRRCHVEVMVERPCRGGIESRWRRLGSVGDPLESRSENAAPNCPSESWKLHEFDGAKDKLVADDRKAGRVERHLS